MKTLEYNFGPFFSITLTMYTKVQLFSITAVYCLLAFFFTFVLMDLANYFLVSLKSSLSVDLTYQNSILWTCILFIVGFYGISEE